MVSLAATVSPFVHKAEAPPSATEADGSSSKGVGEQRSRLGLLPLDEVVAANAALVRDELATNRDMWLLLAGFAESCVKFLSAAKSAVHQLNLTLPMDFAHIANRLKDRQSSLSDLYSVLDATPTLEQNHNEVTYQAMLTNWASWHARKHCDATDASLPYLHALVNAKKAVDKLSLSTTWSSPPDDMQGVFQALRLRDQQGAAIADAFSSRTAHIVRDALRAVHATSFRSALALVSKDLITEEYNNGKLNTVGNLMFKSRSADGSIEAQLTKLVKDIFDMGGVDLLLRTVWPHSSSCDMAKSVLSVCPDGALATLAFGALLVFFLTPWADLLCYCRLWASVLLDFGGVVTWPHLGDPHVRFEFRHFVVALLGACGRLLTQCVTCPPFAESI